MAILWHAAFLQLQGPDQREILDESWMLVGTQITRMACWSTAVVNT